MAKKSSPPTSSGVDFIVRTMLERESSGKRRIRPKNVEDVLLPEDSDDSDYDYVGDSDDYDEDDSAEENSNKSSTSADDSGDSNSDDDSSSDDDSNHSDDDESSHMKGGNSAIRETLKKMNDTSNFPIAKKKRKKPKTKPKVNSSTNKQNNTSSLNNVSPSSESKSKDSVGGEIHQNGPGKAGGAKKRKKPTSTTASKKLKPKVNKKTAHANGSDRGSKSKNKKRNKDSSLSKKKSKYKSISSLVENINAMQAEGRKEVNLDCLICWFCLGDKSDETNEIIECDSCGITIHEMCYGVSDNASVSSGTESSNSTEPWFCDACKSGLMNIKCELCPNQGGVYKETTTGRWVHLICATYTPNARIGEDGLANITDINYSNWGYHACSICEDDRYARIGMTVRCDAGLCKTYLHATCAHKLGLLSDPSTASDLAGDVADPYYANCKMHSHREAARRKADSFKILQEQIRTRQERKQSDELTPKEKIIQNRSKNKIEKIRSKMAAKILQSNTDSQLPTHSGELPNSLPVQDENSLVQHPSLSWKEGVKKPRMLHTSSYIDVFLRKAAIIGLDLAYEIEDKHERIAANVKRKWNIQPALTVEYTAYYLDREKRLETLGDQCEKLEKDKHELIDKHAGLKSAYEEMSSSYRSDCDDGERITKNLESLKEVLTLLSPTNPKLNIVVPKRRHSSSMNRKSPPAKRDKRSPSGKRNKSKSKNSPLHESQSPTGRLGIVKCAVCHTSDNQHLITRCDECKKNYHLRCLDPPLSRMPKKSKSFGWMCSDCGDESEEEPEAPTIDTEAPRTLRGREKLKKPNKYRSVVSPVNNNHVGNAISPKVSSTSKTTPSRSKEKEKSEEHTSYWGPPPKVSPVVNNVSGDSNNSLSNSFNEGKCETCKREDFKKNLVMCDKCSQEFHFLCLDPPLKYSPKRRGYSWFCANCDDASSVDSDSHSSLKEETEPDPSMK